MLELPIGGGGGPALEALAKTYTDLGLRVNPCSEFLLQTSGLG